MERPSFPEDAVCTCGAEDWLECEGGYIRMSSASIVDDVLCVYMDGWDDMSENGHATWMACSVCMAEYKRPDIPTEYM